MKKNLKKIAVGLISTMMLQTCCFMPLASAADVKLDANWDSQAIGTTFGASNSNVNKGGTGTLTLRGYIADDGTETVGSVAADPLDESGANKVFKIDTDKIKTNGNANLLSTNLTSKAEVLQVASAKVMWTGPTKTTSWHIDGKASIKFDDSNGEDIAVTYSNETFTHINYNEWHEIKYVLDTKLTDGVCDKEKSTCSVYLDDTLLISKTWADFNIGNLYLILQCNGGKGNGDLFYIDDFSVYQGATNSELEIKNYDTINGSVYKAGKKLNLEADSWIGKDFGAPFDKIEWYCDGEFIGTGDSIEYTVTAGEHTICAKAYISDELKMTSESLSISVEPSYEEATIAIDVNWDDVKIGKTYGLPNSGNDTTVANAGTGNVYVRYNNDNTVADTTSEEYKKGIAIVAADPTDEHGANKALMIDPNKKTGTNSITLLNYLKTDAGLQVFSEKVMWTGQTSECQWYLYGSTKKVNVVPGTEAIEVKNSAKTETYCTLNYNEWNEFTYVFDVKVTNNGKKDLWDTEKTTCTAYVNGQKLFTDTVKNLGGNVSYGAMQFFTCNAGSGNGALVYFDDVKNYYNLSDASEFEIKNYDDINNSVYMAGTKLKLQADSIIGEDFGAPFDKIEWYCDGALIGTGDSIEYNTTVGGHTICAKAYVGNELKMTSEILKITVEPGFTEDVIMDEDFEDYTDGTTSWYEDDSTSNAWKAPSDASAVTVDNTHKKSLNSGLASGRSVRAETLITDGTVKISGEYYFDSTTNIYDTMMFMLNNGKRDINHLTLRGTNLMDGTNNATAGLGDAFDPAVKLATQRWYKVDLVLTFKDGQGYYNIYLDGRRLTQNAYAFGDFTSVTRTNKVTFLSSYNTTAPIYLDNLKISKINYEESSGFYDGENRVDSLGEVEGAVLTAKTLAAGGLDCRQFMAVYDKTSGRMLDVIEGTFDGATSTFTAECNISAYENFYVKTFLWNEIEPVCAPAEIR